MWHFSCCVTSHFVLYNKCTSKFAENRRQRGYALCTGRSRGQVWVQVSVTAGRSLHLEENNSKAIVEWNIWLLPVLILAFSKQEIYFPLWTPLAQLPRDTNTWLSVRDKITKTTPSSRDEQPRENCSQGRLPISFNSRKSAHIYAWLLKWTAWLLLLICSQWSILSVGTPGGSHAGTGQGKKNTLWT